MFFPSSAWTVYQPRDPSILMQKGLVLLRWPTREATTIKAITKITLPLLILVAPDLRKGYHKSDLRRKIQRAKKPRGIGSQ